MMEGKRVLLLIGFAGMAALSGGWGCSKPTPPAAPTPAPTVTATAATAPGAAAPATAAPAGAAEPIDTEELLIWAEVDEDTGMAPHKVTLSVDPIEEISEPRYTWDFGDGSPPSNELKPEHVYEKPGVYTARVKVTDAAGMVGNDTVEIIVEAPGEAPPADAAAPAG